MAWALVELKSLQPIFNCILHIEPWVGWMHATPPHVNVPSIVSSIPGYRVGTLEDFKSAAIILDRFPLSSFHIIGPGGRPSPSYLLCFFPPGCAMSASLFPIPTILSKGRILMPITAGCGFVSGVARAYPEPRKQTTSKPALPSPGNIHVSGGVFLFSSVK